MNTATTTLLTPLPVAANAQNSARLWAGIAVGLVAASIGALYTVFARWGIQRGLSARKGVGIAVVLAGLVLLSGIDASSFTLRTALGDAMFLAAGTLWAGFGIVLRKHKLDPLLATAVVSFSALLTYVPVYLVVTGGQRLIEAAPNIFWIEVLVQGVIAGAGTLFTYAKMVSLLGPARAAVFPALAPGLAALMAWPVLGHMPAAAEAAGLLVAMTGLLIAVTAGGSR